MEVFFKPAFIRDFQKLPTVIQGETRRICTQTFPKVSSPAEFKEYPLKKIKGFNVYYRIAVKDYRIGLKIEGGRVIFMRVLPRKTIYRHFPW